MARFRLYTCKIVLVTSVVWLMIGALTLMYYTDCAGNSSLCVKKNLVIQDSHNKLKKEFSKSAKAPKGSFSAWKASGNLLFLIIHLYLVFYSIHNFNIIICIKLIL